MSTIAFRGILAHTGAILLLAGGGIAAPTPPSAPVGSLPMGRYENAITDTYAVSLQDAFVREDGTVSVRTVSKASASKATFADAPVPYSLNQNVSLGKENDTVYYAPLSCIGYWAGPSVLMPLTGFPKFVFSPTLGVVVHPANWGVPVGQVRSDSTRTQINIGRPFF